MHLARDALGGKDFGISHRPVVAADAQVKETQVGIRLADTGGARLWYELGFSRDDLTIRLLFLDWVITYSHQYDTPNIIDQVRIQR